MPKNLNHNYFQDREDAARKLYEMIPGDLFLANEAIVIALSEGGVLIADYIAQQLGIQMDILLIESVMAPNNPELAIAKVSETQEMVIHGALIEAFDISKEFVYNEAKREDTTKTPGAIRESVPVSGPIPKGNNITAKI